MKIYFQSMRCCLIKRKIKKILNSALNETPIKFSGFSVNISLVSPEQIQELNKTHRKIDKPTDVLSFPFLELNKGTNFDYKALGKEINPKDGLICLGDIIICKSIAKEQAKNLGHLLKRELCFLSLHGFLHLLGYDHTTDEDEKEMNTLAEKILNNNKVRRR